MRNEWRPVLLAGILNGPPLEFTSRRYFKVETRRRFRLSTRSTQIGIGNCVVEGGLFTIVPDE